MENKLQQDCYRPWLGRFQCTCRVSTTACGKSWFNSFSSGTTIVHHTPPCQTDSPSSSQSLSRKACIPKGVKCPLFRVVGHRAGLPSLPSCAPQISSVTMIYTNKLGLYHSCIRNSVSVAQNPSFMHKPYLPSDGDFNSLFVVLLFTQGWKAFSEIMGTHLYDTLPPDLVWNCHL